MKSWATVVVSVGCGAACGIAFSYLLQLADDHTSSQAVYIENRGNVASADLPSVVEGQRSSENYYEVWQAKLAHHAASLVDAEWAQASAKMLDEDFVALGQRVGFAAMPAECRRSSCVVYMKWPSLSEAQAKYGALLHEPYRLNCLRTITFPEAPAQMGELVLPILFECQ